MPDYKLIGYCAVDSGQILMTDPCYALPEAGKSNNDTLHYTDLIELGRKNNWESQEVLVTSVAGTGVNIAGFGGDGSYPVYIKKNKDGLVTEAKIVFNEEE